MRFLATIEINKNEISRDYRKIIMSFLKKSLENENQMLYESLYNKIENKTKNYTLSTFFKDAKVNENKIAFEDNKIFVTLSFYNIKEALNFYNSLIERKNKSYLYKNDIQLKLTNIKQIQEKEIKENEVIFKTLSNIIVKEHSKEKTLIFKNNKVKDLYYTLNEPEGILYFKDMLKKQIKSNFDYFNEEKFDLEILQNKKVIETNYNIEVITNKSIFKVKTNKEFLNYLYQSGVGQFKSQGFGLLDVLK